MNGAVEGIDALHGVPVKERTAVLTTAPYKDGKAEVRASPEGCGFTIDLLNKAGEVTDSREVSREDIFLEMNAIAPTGLWLYHKLE